MSFSINIQCFENGTFSKFKRSVAWKIFEPFARPTMEGWGLWYEGVYSGTLYIEDDDEIDGISIGRPGDAVFDGLFTILQQTHSAAYWNDACAVADPSVIPGLPSWFIPGLGQPAIVHSGKELIEAIQRS